VKRVYAREDFEYKHRLLPRKLKGGQVTELSNTLADRLVAANPHVLLFADEMESDSLTTMVVTPMMNRHEIPGSPRLSPQKKRQLKEARGRSRHAHLTLTN